MGLMTVCACYDGILLDMVDREWAWLGCGPLWFLVRLFYCFA